MLLFVELVTYRGLLLNLLESLYFIIGWPEDDAFDGCVIFLHTAVLEFSSSLLDIDITYSFLRL